MLAGSLGQLGYFMGDKPLRITDSNPKGFFEDYEIIRINEALMNDAGAFPPIAPLQGWLAATHREVQVVPGRALGWRIRAQVARQPYCFKDPRFCYTLQAWRPFLEDAMVLCIFREPARTANSIMKECARPIYGDLGMTFERAMKLWTLMYSHALDHCRAGSTVAFFHYQQLFNGSAADRLKTLLNAEIDHDFPDPALQHAPATGPVGPDALKLYDHLCSLAGYTPTAASPPDPTGAESSSPLS